MYIICWSWACEADVPVRFWMWEYALVVKFIRDGGDVLIHSIIMYSEMNMAPTGSSHHIFANCLMSNRRLEREYPINGNIREKRLVSAKTEDDCT